MTIPRSTRRDRRSAGTTRAAAEATAVPTQRSWTLLGRRLGVTATAEQRTEILAATVRMSWTPAASVHPFRNQSRAARTVAAAVVRRRDRLGQVGTAELGADRRLIGLRGPDGTRHYLLDQHTPGSDAWLREAVYVLTEYPSQPSADVA